MKEEVYTCDVCSEVISRNWRDKTIMWETKTYGGITCKIQVVSPEYTGDAPLDLCSDCLLHFGKKFCGVV